MKKITFLLFFVSFIANAQVSGSFVIDWKESMSYAIGQTNYNIPLFNSENFFFDEVHKTIEFKWNGWEVNKNF